MVGALGIKFNLTTIIIIVVVLLFLVFLGWYFYRQGKKKVTLQSLPGELPGNPTSGNTTGASNDEIKLIANGIYNDIDGFNIFGHDNAPYNQAVLLNDTDLIKLYNAFNTLYQTQLKETLTQALIDEKFWETVTPNTIIARLQKLNAK